MNFVIENQIKVRLFTVQLVKFPSKRFIIYSET